MRLTILGPLLFALTVSATSQDLTHQELTHFEVASIRPVVIPDASNGGKPVFFPEGGIGSSDPTHIKYKATWLFSLILEAYDLKSFRFSGPKWLNDERYDIVANIPAGATKAQFKIMLQNLLRERFNLTFHYEPRTIAVYALTIGKNGSKLHESSSDELPRPPAGTVIGRPDEDGFPALPSGLSAVVGRPTNGRMLVTAQRSTLLEITGMMQGSVDRPIVDETGLTGKYDAKLEFESRRPGAPSAEASDPAPSAFAAVEKLGLKLEAKQEPFDVLVVDQMEKVPTEN